ncbi:MAG: L-histidine N(alpha)-methyltransferase [Bdellovibrionales bacterium]|jgi:uncharacterized SAM-dependent methyltransferase
MTYNQANLSTIPFAYQECDNVFFDCALDLFMQLRSGHIGKYIYESANSSYQKSDEHVWLDVVENNKTYYLPSQDNNLLHKAHKGLVDLVPEGTPIVDFGVGETSAFYQNILPILTHLESADYYGIDCCQRYLEAIKEIGPKLTDAKIHAINADFFSEEIDIVAPHPSLGIMLCSTIGNLEGTIREKTIDTNLVHVLRILSRTTNHGWMLMSVDMSHEKDALMAGYVTPAVEKFVLNVFHRAAKELPMKGFDPSLFRYTPEWIPENQLFAHIAEATETQNFQLGDYQLQVQKGQKLHLLNSYKFSAPFFESCCDKANLDVLQVWDHESPMKLYLLKDRANTLSATTDELVSSVA